MPISWTDKAEGDLTLAMLLNSQGRAYKPNDVKVNWEAVVETMKTMGYETTRDAVSQRWQKRVVPDLRKLNPGLFSDLPAKTGGGAATAKAPDGKPSTPAKSRKRTRKAAKDDDDELGHADEKPSAKKAKREDHSSMTGADDESV
ncbi:Glycosylphosphatidylinositol (GPI) anchor assembly protein [Hypoxylon texense]